MLDIKHVSLVAFLVIVTSGLASAQRPNGALDKPPVDAAQRYSAAKLLKHLNFVGEWSEDCAGLGRTFVEEKQGVIFVRGVGTIGKEISNRAVNSASILATELTLMFEPVPNNPFNRITYLLGPGSDNFRYWRVTTDKGLVIVHDGRFSTGEEAQRLHRCSSPPDNEIAFKPPEDVQSKSGAPTVSNEDNRSEKMLVQGDFLTVVVGSLVHLTLVGAAFGQVALIFVLIYGFSEAKHEKIMRALATVCGLLIYVVAKVHDLTFGDLFFQGMSEAVPFRIGLIGFVIPSGAGLLVAWYVVSYLNSMHPERNVIGMRVLTMFMTLVFFLYCDSYVMSFGLGGGSKTTLLPNVVFVVTVILYALFKYHPHGKAVSAAAGDGMPKQRLAD
jgi:hypothetical protein